MSGNKINAPKINAHKSNGKSNGNKLKVLPVRMKKEEVSIKIPWPLQQPHFILVICGPCKSGKGVLVMNLLKNNHFGYRQYYKKFIYISPTLPSDKTGQILYKDEDVVKITDNLEHLNEILKMVVEQQKNEIDEPLLLVLDDCLGLLGNNASYFSTLCSKFRHYNMSIIVTTQNFRSIPLICRSNASAYVLFKSHNKTEVSKMDDELGGIFPDFIQLYDTATARKHAFLYLDMNGTAYQNFDEILYEKK